MSSYAHIQKVIQEITTELYPAIDVLFQKVIAERKKMAEPAQFEAAFDTFDQLKEEMLSLKNYELKLVYPGVEKYFGEKKGTLPPHIRINELHNLLRKKEDYVKNKVLELEVELDNRSQPSGLHELTAYFEKEYFCKKDNFYRCIGRLQKERSATNANEIVA